MTPPRDPNEVEQTLLPGAPAKTPAKPSRGSVKPAADTDTPPHPGTADATIETAAPSIAPADAGATRVSGTRSVLPPLPLPPTASSADKSAETKDGVEATLLPSTAGPAPKIGAAPGTVIGSDPTGASAVGGASATSADPGATLVTPTMRTHASASSALAGDTGPMSHASATGGKPGASPSATGTMVGRFALKDLHASGGLGEVFKARDTELNREVAVKRIKSRYADDAGSRRRFLTEAELTARLDHPGVVPVFGLVNDVRGRPCYAMRFIRGETLKDEIDRYYGAQKAAEAKKAEGKTDDTAKLSPPVEKKPEVAPAPAPAAEVNGVPRSVAFRHLLARFIATCQAIAYAHSRNIIHRDIKPANIMVGSFGETLVVDWGLAKSLDDGPDFDRIMKASAEAGFRHDPEATDLPSHMTLAGTAVGTPAYMAPEQAEGAVDKVGTRADVYALGATLYVILTGRAPFGGKTTNEVLELVRRGAYQPAAEANPECPKPLDAIARKAMALRQEDRYATASELAADVERWLSDEPVSCYRDPLFARLARWSRRHPARVATAVSLLLAGLLGAAGVAWAMHEGEKQTREEQKKTAAERDRVIEQEKKTADALQKVTAQEKLTAAERDKVVAQEKQTEEQRARAVELGNVAVGRYEKAVNAYNVLINDVDKTLAGREGMQDLRKTLLVNATEGLKQLVAGAGRADADRTLVAAYRQMGEVYQILGETVNSRENFQLAVDRARDVREEAQKGTSATDKRAADRDLGRSLDKLAGILLRAGDTKTALEKINEAITLFTSLAEDKADATAQQDLAAAKARRAEILKERGETGGALKDCADALAARKELFEKARTDPERKYQYALSLDALSALNLRTGRTKDALANAEESLRLHKELAEQFPKRTDFARELAEGYARLGDGNLERGHLTAARNWYREGASELLKLVSKDPKDVNVRADLAALYGRLGQVQLRTGDIEDAVTSTKAGKELAGALQKADPESAKARRDLALAQESYGDALLAIGRTNEGTKEYAESKALLGKLQTDDKESARAKLDLARGLERFGDGSVAKKDWAGAIPAFEESVKLRREAVTKDGDSASAKRDLAVGLYKLADAHCGIGKQAAAGGFATEATDLFVKLAKDDPDSAQSQRDLALAYGKWGQILVNGGHMTVAFIMWQNSLDRCEKLAKVDSANVQAKEDEATAWERLASFYAAIGNTKRALASASAAVDLWSAIGAGGAHTKAGRRRLALAMLRCGDINTDVRAFKEARDWYKKAAKEADAPGDPLLGPVAKQAAEQQQYSDAVEAALVNPASVMDSPAAVRVPALRTAANIELAADHPTTANAIAIQLAKIASTPAEIFAAARAFAGCAAANRGTEDAKVDYAADALKQLKRAIAEGFRDAEALTAPEWDAVRNRAKDFAKVKEDLEKLAEGK